jgi:hypothetical protein
MADLVDVADDLRSVIDESRAALEAIGEADSGRARAGEGSWSRKQVLGHLVDSALNNLHRFVRAQQVDELVFPGYDQRAWVEAGGYQDRPWTALVALWSDLNRQVAHVIARTHGARLQVPCRIGEGAAVSLEFVARDYVRHLRHHLAQILDPAAAAGHTHAPFAERQPGGEPR